MISTAYSLTKFDLWVLVRARWWRIALLALATQQALTVLAMKTILAIPPEAGTEPTDVHRFEIVLFVTKNLPVALLVAICAAAVVAGGDFRHGSFVRTFAMFPHYPAIVLARVTLGAVISGGIALFSAGTATLAASALGVGVAGGTGLQWTGLILGSMAGAAALGALVALIAFVARSPVTAMIGAAVWILLAEPVATGVFRPMLGDTMSQLLPMAAAQGLMPTPPGLIGGLLTSATQVNPLVGCAVLAGYIGLASAAVLTQGAVRTRTAVIA